MSHVEPMKEETILGDMRTIILKLSNGKKVLIEGNSINEDEAHEIIVSLTETWGTDFEKQELKDRVIMM